MNTDQLKCFVLVAKNLNFARAAEALCITQPAVTKQINSLEKELGTKLFIRTTRHVELTPAGMIFYEDANELLTKSQRATTRVNSQTASTSAISIGLSNHITLQYLSNVIKEFHELYPLVHPNIHVLNHNAAVNLFLDKKLDLLFFYKENLTSTSGVSFKELKKDSLFCIVPLNHPFAIADAITMNDLKSEVIIACNPLNSPLSVSQFQNQLLKEHPVDRVYYCDSIEVSHCMVKAGLGISILPSLLCFKSDDFTTIPLKNIPNISFGVFHHDIDDNVFIKQFVKISKKHFL
ncbi:MAG: LysR family transcriptional regulator [Firmicutes bacterium]|nr:LysR family transcriptional regulator [Bacillota bacterium]